MSYLNMKAALSVISMVLLCYACGTGPKNTSVIDSKDKTSKTKLDEVKDQAHKDKDKDKDQVTKSKDSEQKKKAATNTQPDAMQADKKNPDLATKPDVSKVEVTNKQSETSVTSFKFDIPADINPNRFNRLLEKKHASRFELHDPASPSLEYLQKPADAFDGLPKAATGNKVDWVKAVETGKINPRHDINDPNIKPMIMDLNIVMQVKGSMPDVVFPHKEHTRWLDCSNCHPAIFIPQSGANKMSMADNLLGQKCGVCHGKVAFPLSSCIKCHSNKKIVVQEKK